MKPASDIPCVAFEGDRCIATGDLRDVARAAKRTLDRRKDPRGEADARPAQGRVGSCL